MEILTINTIFGINNNKRALNFGSTAKLFEAINEDELKSKLEETLEEMNNLFDISNVNFDEIKQDLSKKI